MPYIPHASMANLKITSFVTQHPVGDPFTRSHASVVSRDSRRLTQHRSSKPILSKLSLAVHITNQMTSRTASHMSSKIDSAYGTT